MGKVSEAKKAAHARYDAKTYTRFGLYLRIDDDADIIASMQYAKDNGVSLREWLRDVYDRSESK